MPWARCRERTRADGPATTHARRPCIPTRRGMEWALPAGWKGERHGDAGDVPGAVFGGLPGPAAEQGDLGLPDLRRDPDPDRARKRLGQRDVDAVLRARRNLRSMGRGWAALPGSVADDPLPTEVPALVVRLEPGAPAVHEPGPRIRPADGRPVSGNRPGAVRPPRLPVPGRGAGPQPVAPAGEVVPSDPPLHRAVLPVDRARGDRDRRVVRDPLHRTVPEGDVRFRRGRDPLGRQGGRLRVHTRHGSLPALLAGTVALRTGLPGGPDGARS